jgi:outer membrane immunogenic protein
VISHTGDAGEAFAVGTHVSGSVDWLASLRGRLGMVLDPNLLVYATGGIAWTRTQTELGSSGAKRIDHVLTGGVVGGGAEWKYNPNIALRLEGLYYIFDESHRYVADTGALRFDRETWSATGGLKNIGVIRVGASWYFGGPADLLGKSPVVVARY